MGELPRDRRQTPATCRAASWPRSGRPTRGRIAWTIRSRRRRTIRRAFCRRATAACSRQPRRWRRGSTGTSPSRTRRSTWSGTRTPGRSIISRLVGDPTVPRLVPPRLAHRRSTPQVHSTIMVSIMPPPSLSSFGINFAGRRICADKIFHVFPLLLFTSPCHALHSRIPWILISYHGERERSCILESGHASRVTHPPIGNAVQRNCGTRTRNTRRLSPWDPAVREIYRLDDNRPPPAPPSPLPPALLLHLMIFLV